MACIRPEEITSDGTFHQLGADAFIGEMHTTTTAAGRAMMVLTTYAGRQIGTCPYTPPAR